MTRTSRQESHARLLLLLLRQQATPTIRRLHPRASIDTIRGLDELALRNTDALLARKKTRALRKIGALKLKKTGGLARVALLSLLPLLYPACGDDVGQSASATSITSASASASNTDTATNPSASASAGSSSGSDSASEGSAATGVGTSSGPSTTSGTATGEPELPCDPGFSFVPKPAETGAILQASFTHAEPLTYIGMTFSGPGEALVVDNGITGSDPWTWNFKVALPEPGIWTAVFVAGEPQATVATCQIQAIDTGEAPDPTTGEPGGNDCLCGEGEGCDLCPVVGTCLDPPSPIGPDGPGMIWECLDNAGCDGGSCKIWCPFEPCDTEKHPKGCPNNTEACWVPAWMDSYEEACKHCCESEPQSSCWDDAYNVCRYPGECGTPLP